MSKKVEIIIQAIDQATNTIDNITGKMGMIGAAGLGLAGAAAGEFAEYNAILGRTAAVAGMAKEEMDGLSDVLRKTATDTAAVAVELARGAYDFASAGGDIVQDIGLYNDALNLSIGTGGDFNESIKITTALIEQFGLSAADSAKIVDSLAQSTSSSKVTLNSLFESFKVSAPLAAALGQNVYNLEAAFKGLSKQSIIGSEAGTAVNAIFARLSDPSNEAASAIRNLGLSLDSVNPDNVQLPDIIAQFEDLEMTSKDLFKIFGQEAVPAFTALKAIGSEALREMAYEAENAAGQAKEMADIVNGLDSTKLQNMTDELKDMAYEVGPAVIEAFEEMFKPIKDAKDYFTELGIEADVVKDIVKVMAGLLVTSLGGQALSGAGQLLKVVTKIGTHFGLTGAAAAGLGTGVVALGAAATTLVGLDIKLFSDAKNIRETALATGELNQTMIALSQVRVQMPDLEKYINSLAEAVAKSGDMAKSEALDFVVNGMITPEFMVEFNEKNNVSGEIQETYNHFINEFRSGFDLSDDVKLDLSSAISADTASFAQKMDNVVKATSGASEGMKANLDDLTSTAKDAGKRFGQLSDEFDVDMVWDPDTESFVLSFKELEDSLKKQLQSTTDTANEGVDKVTSAISQLWNATDEEGKSSGPLSGIKKDIEQDVQDIQKLLDTMNLNKMGLSFEQLGENLNNMITEDLKMDIAETQLKLQMESLLNTVYDSTGQIPEEMKKLGEQIDMTWWTDMVGEITGANVDISGVVDGVKSGSEQMSEELNKFKDYGVQIKPEWKTEELEKIAEQLTKRRNLTVPEINVIGSNITKHRVQIVLDLNKEEFMKQWSALGLSMTSTLENSLLYD